MPKRGLRPAEARPSDPKTRPSSSSCCRPSMLKLLVYAYSIGVTSSGETERRCHTDVALRFLSANDAPGYRSTSRFRRRHLEALRPPPSRCPVCAPTCPACATWRQASRPVPPVAPMRP